MFLTDSGQTVRYWSPSAERIFGRRAEDVIGLPCHQVLAGTDRAGNAFCRNHCPVTSNAAKGRPVRDYEIVVETPGGRRKLISNTIVLWPEESGGHSVLHLVREVRHPASRRRSHGASGALSPDLPLSRREAEVLRLAATGMRTAEIAATLGVSFFTARNQLSSVLRKLNARSRVEAIIRAREFGL